jgi:hypothetical protein
MQSNLVRPEAAYNSCSRGTKDLLPCRHAGATCFHTEATPITFGYLFGSMNYNFKQLQISARYMTMDSMQGHDNRTRQSKYFFPR